MPYLPKWRKDEIDNGATPPKCGGDLNYALVRMMQAYVKAKGLSYETLNDIAGALENFKLEWYRRVVIPYEEKKRRENGDVF